ncbi:MAG: hypothetical protein GXY50_10315 [Syntrophomonadaceae bacterium]|nr:hypothetical protein [Syntrophomonadaceae bacterium]
MPSKTSFIKAGINGGILRNDIKSFGWLGAAYLLALLLSFPLTILMIYSQEQQRVNANDLLNQGLQLADHYLPLFQFNSELQLILFLTVPILTGLLLFRYLQSRKAADMIHSLPVRRETLYNTHILAGIILLFVPIIITALTSWALVLGLGIEGVPFKAMMMWLGVALLFNLLLFICTVAVGVLTGISTVQGALTYILLLFPTGFMVLLLDNLNTWLFGFPSGFYEQSLNFSPLTRLVEIYSNPLSGTEVAVYLLIIAAIYLLGIWFYRRRRIEMTGNAIAFEALHPVFKYGVAFCTMLLGGSYFSSQYSLGWTYFGYFLGAFLGYYLSVILINKTWQVFNRQVARGFAAYVLIIVVALVGLNYDVLGYEKRIPSLANVETVYMDYSFHRLINDPEQQDYYSDQYRRTPKMIYMGPDNIGRIHQLHQAIIANRALEKKQNSTNNTYNNRYVCLAYQLKNGNVVYRSYYIPQDQYAAWFKPIYESQEHKRLLYDILNIAPEQADFIQINANFVGRNVKIGSPALVKEAVQALQRDAQTRTYEEITNDSSWADIEILLSSGKRISLAWNKGDTVFEDYLRRINQLNNSRIMVEDITSALVGKTATPSTPATRVITTKEDGTQYREMEESGEYLKITDPQQLEICLKVSTFSYWQEPIYTIMFLLNNGNVVSGAFTSETIPEFVKAHFGQ